MEQLALKGVQKRFGSTIAVDNIDISVPAGSFLVLLGPSGCGKTTTLRMLAGLEDPTAGTIEYGGQVVADGDRGVFLPPAKRNAGLVFQSYALWPHKTVHDNVAWPLKIAKWNKADIDDRVTEVLTTLDIAHLAQRYPGEISGGQQQRVAIARMLAPTPAVLLFDEPLSNLDAKLRVETRAELIRIHRTTGATCVYVTHDQVEAMAMATHIALLNNGRVEQFGTPEDLLENPASPFVATFMGTPPNNVLEGRYMYRPTSVRIEEGSGAQLIDQVPMADRWVIGAELADGTRVTAVQAHPVLGPNVRVIFNDTPDKVFEEVPDAIVVD